jgi:hypothetical protein
MAEANAGVDAIYPDVDVVSLREISLHESLALRLPLLGEAGDGRGREPGFGAKELLQSGQKVPA